jgi:signal transduction histidine kinase/CheY-like chemotaxis protein
MGAAFPAALLVIILVLLQLRYGVFTKLDAVTIALVAVLVALAVAMSVFTVRYSRRILELVRVLDEWTQALQGGDIDRRIEVGPGDDEASRVANGLNQVLQVIKDGYVSARRESLTHRQRAERQTQLAAASMVGTKHLTDALQRMKESQGKAIQEERQKALEQVVRGVAHDFGDALTPIVGTADLLFRSPELLDNKEAMVRHIAAIRRGADEAQASLRYLAGFFRQLPVNVSEVDLNQVVRQAASAAETQWREESGNAGKQPPRLNLNMGTIPIVQGEEAGLSDAIADLLLNAMEASPPEAVVTVSTQSVQGKAVLEIADRGAGMSEDVRARCMEPFFTTKGPRRKGMGLARTMSTARAHNGELRIDSEPGKGTRVSLVIPSKDPGGPAATAHAPADTEPAPQNLRIIVVDDEAPTREIIAHVATNSGHTVVKTANAEECLKQMRIAPFDVAVVDMAMPGMRGDELAGIIKRSFRQTAVVMVTGFGHIMREEGTIPPDVDVLMPKPVTVQELRDSLAAAVLRHRERSQNPAA